MQILINIPDEEFERLVYMNIFKLREYIQNGVVLPKGHKRLIEVTDDLECKLFNYTQYTGIDEAPYEDATTVIDNTPTVIEAESEG